MEPQFIISYRELKVYQSALDHAMQVFEVSRTFPAEEQQLLTHPVTRTSRLVCVYIAQAWQKRRYQTAFIARLNQAESEAAATQVWIEFAVLCNHLDAETGQELYHHYQEVLAAIAWLVDHAAVWVTPIQP